MSDDAQMVLDVVCDMEVLPFEMVAESTYNGKTYQFCSDWCKRKFDANPELYVTTGKSSERGGSMTAS